MATEAKKVSKKLKPPKPAKDSLDEVEQDIWVQLPPIREFTIKAKIEYQGRAKPRLFADWVESDE
jgi:hypothetical protein